MATAALLSGVALVGAGAVAAGSWAAAREPWVGLGLTLSVVGLAGTQVFGLVVVATSARLRWWRLLAVPPGALVAMWWYSVLAIGVGTTGFGGPEHDPRVILFSSAGYWAVVLGVPTAAIVTLATLSRVADRPKAPHDADAPSLHGGRPAGDPGGG